MHGYVGITDFEWYTFLAAHPELKEVNFWRPSGGDQRFSAIPPGSPFFFKLKSPHRAIGGFGTFSRYARVPITTAWETLTIANGAPDLASLDRVIRQYRASKGTDPGEGPYFIGCIIISNPVFFDKNHWVREPTGWGPGIMQGKAYDLSTDAEGARIYRECSAQAAEQATAEQITPLALTVNEQTERYGTPQLVRPRLGQGAFRFGVLEAYEYACAVTDERSIPVLEAAHIQRFSAAGSHEIKNGLLLRIDIHRLFDAGYVTITPDYEFKVSARLRTDFTCGETYYALQNKKIRLPKSPEDLPSQESLSWHAKHVFLG